MAFKIYVYTGADSIDRAIVPSLTDVSRPSSGLPAAVIGSARDFELHLLSGASTYDARSGNANYTPRLGAGPIGGVASGGNMTLTDGTDTTASISATAEASALQAALNALNTSAGPSSGTVTVSRPSAGVFIVDWDAVGARDLLSAAANTLTPESAVVVDRTRTGDGSTKEQQTIRLARQPAIYAEGLTPVDAGGGVKYWTGTLSANNARVLQLLAGAEKTTTDFEIEIEGPSGAPDVVARAELTISNEIVNIGALTADDLPSAILASNVQVPRVLPGITDLTGGTATDLDGIATTSLSVGWLYILPNVTIGASVVSKQWILVAGTDAEDAGNGIIRPDDYAASTNEKVWKAV